MPDPATHVIVGAGHAGATAAGALRHEGFEGRIVLLGDEAEEPYERPPLSKDYLRGESPREKARVHPAGFYERNGIELRTATPVERIDTAASEVALTGGERLRYDRLLLATGAEPRRLAVPGADLEGVHALRSLPDADAIARRLGPDARLVVVGGGWIGAEVAASARQRGAEVTLVERSDVPLERVLGRQLGEVYAALHRDHGVRLVAAATVEAFEGERAVERVRLADGRRIECDLAVVGVGVVPRTALAEAAGLAVADGIRVSAQLETSAPGVFAAGDVASAFHPFYARPLRVEHWANALHQGEAVARAMLGKPVAYDRLPYFFSDQYDAGMEYAGVATAQDTLVVRGDLAAREFVAFWLREERLVAAMNVNVWDVTDAAQELIRSRVRVDAKRLRDPDVPLEAAAATRRRPASGARG